MAKGILASLLSAGLAAGLVHSAPRFGASGIRHTSRSVLSRLRCSHAPSAQPTMETGVDKLMQQTGGEADGRGTLVGVFDTGCDLAAAGLLTTSDGKPKFVDFLDCTGGGDIDTSKKEASREEDGGVVLNGLSGRTLKLGEWARGTSEFRVGATRLLALLPSSVRRRIAAERKASFEVAQHAHVTRVQRELDALESGEGKLTGFAKTAAKKDLELMLTELKAMMDSYDDAGPLLDVVLYKEGGDDGVWRAVVDTGGAGDLTAASPMAPYRHERQVSQLGFGTELTYCVQVYDEGGTLCIVTDAGSHGTHVAGIVAANFEDAPERNGVAPGAQILACKIGDGRLDSAETGTGLVRALIAAKAAGCDLINLSYGEPFWQGEGGRVAQTFTDAVRKWNMAVFTSAGNSGPALSTLGAPGCLTAPITVGAYVSPPMMADQYSMLPSEEVEATCYWFTSRGPTPDGYMPTLCAPGGAIAPVPRHALQGKAQYHGTSMASPNACGVAACVLSALRQAGVEVGPIELRRALENSATPVEQLDPFGQGAGLINAPGAVEYAMAHHGKPAQHLDFEVTVPGRNDARGIYLRDQQELDGPLSIGVKVVPLFEHPTGAGRSASDLEELLGTDLDIALSSTAEWLATPPSMVLLSAKERGGQSFVVRVDPAGLAPGVHFARVEASDATDASRGPLFSLPVTVVVPEPPAPPNEPTRFELDLLPGAPARRFLSAPADAEWATVKLMTGAMPKGPHTVLFHAVPTARGDMPHDLIQTFRMLALREHSETTVQVPVRGGATLELCMSLSWLANPSPVEALGATVEFHSYGARGRAMAAAVSRPLRIGAADSSARLEVSAPLHTEKLNPKAELSAIERTLRPASAVIAAASAELDVLPPSDAELRASATAEGTQIHQMVLQYKFEVTEKDAISIMPRVQSLHAQLYDSPLDSMLWRLQDANGATLQYGGAIHDAAPTKLGKGNYVVDLLLRHPDRAQLSSLKDLPLMLHMALAKPLGCTVYGARDAAASRGHGGAAKVGAGWLRKGGHKDLYVCPPSGEGDQAVPKWAAAGDVMVGELLLDSLEPSVSAMPLVYEVPAHPIEAAKDDDDDDDDDDDTKDGSKDGSKDDAEAKDADAAKGGAEGEGEAVDEEAEKEKEAKDEEALSKKLLQASLDQLKSLRTSSASSSRYDKLSQRLLADNPTHLPLLLELLAYSKSVPPPKPKGGGAADKEQEARSASRFRAGAVSEAAERVSAAVDESALALYYGKAQPDATDAANRKAAKKEAKERGEERSALRSALLARASALAPPGISKAGAHESDELTDRFKSAVGEMKAWCSAESAADDEEKHAIALTLAKFELAMGRPGSALAVLRARLGEQTPGTKDGKAMCKSVAELCRELRLEEWADNVEEKAFKTFPIEKLPF